MKIFDMSPNVTNRDINLKETIISTDAGSEIKQNLENEAKSSPLSEKSNNISIVSLKDDCDSSIASDSDCDYDIEDYNIAGTSTDRIENVENGTGVITTGAIVVSQNIEKDVTKPQIGSIAVQNSSDITFGNKTFYQGPVTIKQFLLDHNKWKPNENGQENSGYTNSGETINADSGHDNHGYEPTGKAIKLFLKKMKFIIIGMVSIIAIMIIILLSVYVFSVEPSSTYKLGDGDDSRKNIPINSSIGNVLLDGGSSLRFVSRDEWIAQPARAPLTKLELPSEMVIITHTATENCSTQAVCTFRVRFMQTFHMESRGWDDIAYNFMVGGDGSVYEGRGWDLEGAHTKGYNKKSIGIAFIGTFNTVTPPQRQINATLSLIQNGVNLGKLDKNYKLYGHRQLASFESPGDVLYAIIQKWPHWTDSLD